MSRAHWLSLALGRSRRPRPDDLLDAFSAEAKRRADAIGRELARAVCDAVDDGANGRQVLTLIDDIGPGLDITDLAELGYELALRASMLGADDSDREGDTGSPVAVAAFSGGCSHIGLAHLLDATSRPPIPPEFITSGKLRPKPFDAAIEAFRSRAPVTRDVFDQLDERARADAFTMAKLTSNKAVEVVQREVRRSLEEANWDEGQPITDLRTFRRNIQRRLHEGGILVSQQWVPEGPGTMPPASLDPNHVETVFRNGVMGAYADGRRHHMQQPHILAARPYWQIVTVNDGPPRQRPTHQNVHGWVMLADDPAWQQAAPPFGHNCRCRLVARSARWVERNGPHLHAGPLPNLPDPGWTTRNPPPMIQVPLPFSPEAAPPTTATKIGPPPKAQPATAPRGPSVVRASDAKLPRRQREAIERLDALPRAKGRIEPERFGLRRADEARRSALERAKANIDIEGIRSDPDIAIRSRGYGGSRVDRDTVEATRIVVHRDDLGAKGVATAVREQSRGPLLVEWPNKATGELELHAYGTASEIHALAADAVTNEGKVVARVLRYTPDSGKIAEALTPHKSRPAELRALASAAKSTRRTLGRKLRPQMRKTLAKDGIISRDVTTARSAADKLSVAKRSKGGAGAMATHDGISGKVWLRTDVADTTAAVMADLEAGAAGKLALNGPAVGADMSPAAIAMRARSDLLRIKRCTHGSALVHEEIHGASSLRASAISGPGLAFEEATTELLSRRTMRRLANVKASTLDKLRFKIPDSTDFARDWRGASYGHAWARPVDGIRHMHPYDKPIAKLLGAAKDHGFDADAVERAAARLRGPKYRGRWFNSGAEVIEAFAAELLGPGHKAAARTKLADAVRRAMTMRRLFERVQPLPPTELVRNDLDGALRSFRAAKAAGLLDYTWLMLLVRLQDDPRALLDVVDDELSGYQLGGPEAAGPELAAVA